MSDQTFSSLTYRRSRQPVGPIVGLLLAGAVGYGIYARLDRNAGTRAVAMKRQKQSPKSAL